MIGTTFKDLNKQWKKVAQAVLDRKGVIEPVAYDNMDLRYAYFLLKQVTKNIRFALTSEIFSIFAARKGTAPEQRGSDHNK